MLSVYKTTKGIIVDIQNESNRSETVFSTKKDMLDHLDSLKKNGDLEEYVLNVANEFWASVINHLSL